MRNLPVVFISSTVEDLRSYRRKAEEAANRADFHPRMMEYFVASGNPPLPKCLQEITGADMLVVIVAHRYGWVPEDQPGGGDKSITWLECEQAERDGKEILAFLVEDKCDWPLDLRESYRLMEAAERGTDTPELQREVRRNIARLAEFKGWLSQGRIRVRFTNPDHLRGEVESALREWRDRRRGRFAEAQPPADDPARYLEDLRDRYDAIDIRGLEVGSGRVQRLPVEYLYIPLATAERLEEAGPQAGRAQQAGREMLPLEEALAHAPLVIIGDAGSGKSTFLKSLAFALSYSLIKGKLVAGGAQDAFAARLSAPLSGGQLPLPVLVPVGRLAEHIRNAAGTASAPATRDNPEWLLHYLNAENQANNWGLSDTFFREQLKDGQAILLLDGLDEAPSRRERESLARLFESARRAYRGCRWVVTTRPQAYEGEAILGDFRQARIEPLEPEAIEKFLEQWCRALFGETSQAGRHRAELSRSLASSAEIRRLVRNPLMLTALAVVHWHQKQLPEQRAALYDSILGWLAKSREDRPGREPAERCLALLQQLALAMQDHPEGRVEQVSRRWGAEKLAAVGGGVDRAEAFLEEEENDSGIIVSRGNEVRFWHLTFQEYLAARAISGLADSDQHKLLFDKDKIYRPEWRETALLLAGVLCGQGPAKVDGLFSAALDGLGKRPKLAARARCAGLLGQMLLDLAPLKYEPADPQYRSTLDAVLGVFEPERARAIDFRVRLEAAGALVQAGDPRLGREQNWVTIDSGEFEMGSTDHKSEQPVHRVHVDAFQIGRYPVTVEEYRRFIEDGGYENQKWWVAGGFGQFQAPGSWDDQLQHRNRPVVRVSWFEAAAYCAWAGVWLPTEAEWERAARGREGRKYPWGNEEPSDERANFKMDVGHPTPVGLYPLGATPEGVDDLAGNVWELGGRLAWRLSEVSTKESEGAGERDRACVARGRLRRPEEPARRLPRRPRAADPRRLLRFSLRPGSCPLILFTFSFSKFFNDST